MDDPVTFKRATDRGRHDALSLLLAVDASAAAPAPALHRFLAYADQEQLSLDALWVAQQRGRTIGSVLIVPSAGRTAMIFTSPVRSGTSAPIMSKLLRKACRALDWEQVRLVQAILEPGQRHQENVYARAGFRILTHLIYMQRRPRQLSVSLKLDDGLATVQWHERNRQLFADAILASYEGTQDCPGLVGLREISDIVDGHMAAGEFMPELWFALHHAGEPVGVMLLNHIPQHRALELVYLGFAPKYRGRGLGRKLMEHALTLADQQQRSSLILAVDDKNETALNLYRSLKFSPYARKLAMILKLR